MVVDRSQAKFNIDCFGLDFVKLCIFMKLTSYFYEVNLVKYEADRSQLRYALYKVRLGPKSEVRSLKSDVRNLNFDFAPRSEVFKPDFAHA